MKVRFKANIWRTGNTNVLTVPAQYVKDEVLNAEKDYFVTLEEVQNDLAHNENGPDSE